MNETMSSKNLHGSFYILQIDLIKGLAMISVILLHTLPRPILIQTYSQFHIWQAVPIFFILMGITSGISFSRRGYTRIKQIYSRKYFLRKFERLIVPFLTVFLISLVWGIYHNNFYIGWLSLIGKLPVSGPGNYFVSIVLQYIFIFPLIYILYKKSPNLMLITLFSIDFLFQLVAPYLAIFDNVPYLYGACIFRYFSAIALGLYISEDLLTSRHIELLSKKNRFILVGVPISIVYLFMARFTRQPFFLFSEARGFQNVISFFYPLLLVVIMLRFFPEKTDNVILNSLATIGKASYHIFLIQILFFGFGLSFVRFVNWDNLWVIGPLAILANIISATILGLIFYFFEKNFKVKFREKMSLKYR
jgi:peptidoglycan/LPS O-acetylase OafA/YrhL